MNVKDEWRVAEFAYKNMNHYASDLLLLKLTCFPEGLGSVVDSGQVGHQGPSGYSASIMMGHDRS